MGEKLRPGVHRGVTGFGAGVLTAVSVFRLIIPAMDRSAHLGRWAFFPAFAGAWIGILALLLFERLLPAGPLRVLAMASLVILPMLSGGAYAAGISAGAMLFIVVEKLVPNLSAGENPDIGSVFFGLGFTLVMVFCALGRGAS